MVERIAKASKVPVVSAHKGLNMGTDVVRATAPTWWALPACCASRRPDCVYNSAYIAILNLVILRIAVLKVHATMTKASEMGENPQSSTRLRLWEIMSTSCFEYRDTAAHRVDIS